ncbi:Transmembrane protein 214-B [Trichoplax sp. H2]|nr:Transmembrane protein 214-B [Trichoplax sp. H2]|eukprot:RDD43277.1 Transmembrane protein 214-B [Trichoplax sp. H2]
MASHDLKWHVVKSQKKDHGKDDANKNSAGSEARRQQLKAPSKTNYQNFNDVGRDTSHTKGDNNSTPKMKDNPAKPRQRHGDAAKTKVKKEDKLPLQELIANLEENELASTIEQVRQTFPSNSLIWLNELVGYVQMHLSRAENSYDAIFTGKSKDFPMNLLSNKFKQLAIQLLEKCPEAVISIFFEDCIDNMLKNIRNNIQTYGYRIMIQIMTRYNPAIVLNKISTYKPSVLEIVPYEALSILWAFNQASIGDVAVGYQVWFELMFPAMNVRSLAPYAITVIEDLFKSKKSKNINKIPNVGPKEFVTLLHMLFSDNSSLHASSRKKLISLYPKLKDFILTHESTNNYRNYFSLLLPMLSNSSDDFRKENLHCLKYYLEKDHYCLTVWKEMYRNNIPQSRILFCYMKKAWSSGSLSKKGDYSLLITDTINHFISINTAIISKKRNKAEDVAEFQSEVKAFVDNAAYEKKPNASMTGSYLLYLLILLFLFGLGTLHAIISYPQYFNLDESQVESLRTHTRFLSTRLLNYMRILSDLASVAVEKLWLLTKAGFKYTTDVLTPYQLLIKDYIPTVLDAIKKCLDHLLVVFTNILAKPVVCLTTVYAVKHND